MGKRNIKTTNINSTAKKHAFPVKKILPSLQKNHGIAKKEKRKEKRNKLLQTLQSQQMNKRSKSKKPRNLPLESLDSLKASLPDLNFEIPQIRISGKLTAEKRQKIAKLELQQFHNVLEHPAFAQNPLAAITEHLKNKVLQLANGKQNLVQ